MKVVLQDGIKDCGVCCLLSIIRYYGGDLSKEFLRDLTHTTKSGVNAYDLIRAAEEIGFEAYAMKGEVKQISKDNLPCIAHVLINKQYKHFVVIYSMDNNTITIMDPAKGKRVLSKAEFNLLTTYYYIFLKPIKTLPIVYKKNSILKIVVEYFNKNKLYILFIIILFSFYFIFQIILAYHFKYLLEYCINYNYSFYILPFSIILFIIYIFKELNDFLKNKLLSKVTHQLDYLLFNKLYKQILLLPYLYYKNRTTGEVIQRFRDLGTIKNYIVNLLCSSITDFLGIIIFLILLLSIDIKLTVISLVFSVLLLIGIYLISKTKKAQLRKTTRCEDKVNSYLIESLSSVDSLKNNHCEKRIFDVFSIKYKNLLENSYNLLSINSKLTLLKAITNDLFITVILGFGAYLVIKNKVELSQIIVYQGIFNYYLMCLYSLVNLISNHSEFSISLERINDLFMNNTEMFQGSYYYLGYHLNNNIKFTNLFYKIRDKVLFDNINFEIFNKDKVLLLGKSGSGKSTLAKILMRYFKVDFGMVSINNIDINHYHLEIIRNNITYVGCNELLFSNSLYYNITLGKDVDKNIFDKVVKICKVSDFVLEKDLEYKMVVEENGINFSNGERQRILLSRALLRNSDIYIFDEAFSQIDFYTRKIIINDVLKYLKNKTVIVISHNIKNYKLFNRVLDLKNGKIYEREKL